MATKRLTISMDERFYDVVSRMAELQGRSMSAVLNDFHMSMYEPLMRTVALIDAANQAPEQVKQGLRETAERLERDLAGLGDQTILDLGALLSSAESDVSGGVDPRLVTRGSGGGVRVRSQKGRGGK